MKKSLIYILAVLLIIVGLGFTLYSSTPSFAVAEKRNIDFVISVEEIDNIFSDNELRYTHEYRVTPFEFQDYLQFSETFSVFQNVKDVVLTSVIYDETKTKIISSKKLTIGDFGLIKDKYESKFNYVLPVGTYYHKITSEYDVGSSPKLDYNTYKVVVE